MNCHKFIGGWFYERSHKANAYGWELLGMEAVHLLASFATKFYNLSKCRDVPSATALALLIRPGNFGSHKLQHDENTPTS
jgi:hypothetical protein